MWRESVKLPGVYQVHCIEDNDANKKITSYFYGTTPSLTLEQSKSGFNPFKYKGLSHFCYENDMYYFFILMFLKVL